MPSPLRKPSPSRLRDSINTHIAALRRLGCVVEVSDPATPGGKSAAKVTLPTGLSKAEAQEQFVSRNQLVGIVKESERTIIDKMLSGGYMEHSPGARRGGGYQLTTRAYRFATQVGSLIYYDPKRTMKVLGLTANDEYL